ncbi:MAG: hypothetical protein ACHBNF_06925 [Chromatiales bacterium]
MLELYRRGLLVFEGQPIGATPNQQEAALVRAIRDGVMVLKE